MKLQGLVRKLKMNVKKKSRKKINLKSSVLQLDLKDKEKLQAAVISYDTKNDKAPRITGFGKGRIAEKILKVAEDHKIPFYEDAALVELLSKLDIKSEVPPLLYTMVAEILSFVYRLERLAKKRSLFTSKATKDKNA